MVKETIRIVIVGEVDHGKSTLIGRLLLETGSLSQEKIEEVEKGMELAFLTDQFKEEREEEKTIDTTQVFLRTKKRRFCFIDTPGHIEFIKNMMTGATRADVALVTVDARSGLKEQTKRHLALLSLFGIRQVIVAINKMDLVGYNRARFLDIQKHTETFLEKTKLLSKGAIPISAKNGANIVKRSKFLRWHKGPSLLKVLDALRMVRQYSKKPLRFPIQDVYEIEGKKIVVGRIESGSISMGQEVLVLPRSKKAKVISIRIFGKIKRRAEERENIGLILKDAGGVKRGEIICPKKDPPQPLSHFQGNIFWLSDQPLKINKKMIFRCTTQEVACVVEHIQNRMDSSTLKILKKNPNLLKKNEIGKVTIKTSTPVVIENFYFVGEMGRFVFEREGIVCGAGIVLPYWA